MRHGVSGVGVGSKSSLYYVQLEQNLEQEQEREHEPEPRLIMLKPVLERVSVPKDDRNHRYLKFINQEERTGVHGEGAGVECGRVCF